MNRLFAGIRWRLVAWSMLILGTILVLLGATIYVAVARSLLDEVDRNLYSRSEQAGPTLFPPPGRGPRQAPVRSRLDRRTAWPRASWRSASARARGDSRSCPRRAARASPSVRGASPKLDAWLLLRMST